MGRMCLKFKGETWELSLNSVEEIQPDFPFTEWNTQERIDSGLRDPAPLSPGAVHGGEQAAEEG